METNFKPLGDRVLVKPKEIEEKSKGGLILNDSISRGQKLEGEVISVGTGLFSQTGNHIPMTVRVGDVVLYSKDEATNKLTIEGNEYLLFREHELIGIFGRDESSYSINIPYSNPYTYSNNTNNVTYGGKQLLNENK
jgi:chaperonin GroES